MDLVAVAHPHGGLLGERLEEVGPVEDVQVGAPELAVVGAVDLAAEREAGGLHAVADAEDGGAAGEHAGVESRGAVGVDGGGAAGEDDAPRLEAPDLGEGVGRRDEQAVDAGVAHASGDELGRLGAEVHDEDDLVVHRRAVRHALDRGVHDRMYPGRGAPASRGPARRARMMAAMGRRTPRGTFLLICAAAAAAAAGACSAPAPRASFDSNAPEERVMAAAEAAREGDAGATDDLIAMLDSADPAQRMLASEALRRVTGEDFGYHYADPAPRREEAIGRWVAWRRAGGGAGAGP